MLDRSFNFILSYPTSVVSQILKQFSPNRNALILDPFCGTGTTLVECKRRGFRSIGIDANPVCILAARAKTQWMLDESKVHSELKRILGSARHEYKIFEEARLAEKVRGKYLRPSKWKTFGELRQGRYVLASGLLKRGWISPRPALKCLLIVKSIERCQDAVTKELLLLSLLGLLVPEFSNMKYGPEIYCSRKRLDIDVYAIYRKRVRELLSSIVQHRSIHAGADCSVIRGNSLDNALLRLEPESISHIITSPPYPAEHDYTRMTRLELAFGGFVEGSPELRTIKRDMVPCSSKSSYADQKYFEHVKRFSSVRRIKQQVLDASKGKDHGFAKVYPRLVGDYFGAMYLHFRALRRILKPGAQCAYVVGDQSSFFGVHIQTSDILQRMLKSKQLGFEVTGVEVLRHRHGSMSKSVRRLPETILYFKKPLDRVVAYASN
jgi:DNA methylase